MVLNIWNIMLFTELLYSWSDLAVVWVGHAREQVMLDLEVDASEDKSIYGAVGLEISAVLDLELQPIVAFVMIFNWYIKGVVVAYNVRLV